MRKEKRKRKRKKMVKEIYNGSFVKRLKNYLNLKVTK